MMRYALPEIRRSFRRLSIGLTAFVPLILAGCGTIDRFQNPIVQPCPEYFILEDASTLTKFRDGPGRDLIDIEYRAKMQTIRLECTSSIDHDTKIGEMEIDVIPVIGAELGAAFQGTETVVPMFIVVTDPSKKIIYREETKMALSFEGNRTRLIAMAPATTIVAPITPEFSSKYYRIYGGFALTKEEAEYNRLQIQKGLR